uniref:Gamma-tubulin complex component n=1 Tax=Romanomermis culicivorax TaxID=13658 RepID=A0A915KID2_ROMCU
MIEEILLALSGLPDCWLDSNDSWLDQHVLKSALDLHPGESEILARLLSLSKKSCRLRKFSRNSEFIFLRQELGDRPENNEKFSGYYEAILARSIDGILVDFTKILCDLETSIKNDVSKRNLMFLLSEIEPFFSVFDILLQILDEISDRRVKGCALLKLIYSNVNNHVPIVGVELNKIRRNLCKIFAEQLTEFLKFGRLTDKYDEFFISCAQSSDEHHVKDDFRPAFVSDHLCSKICFIGEKMMLINSENNIDLLLKNNLSDNDNEDLNEIRRILVAENFDPQLLNEPIENLHKCLSKKLWKSITKDEFTDVSLRSNNNKNIFNILSDIRNFYFLGNGELFMNIIDQLDNYSFSDIQQKASFSTNYSTSIDSAKYTSSGNLKNTINNLKVEHLNRLLSQYFKTGDETNDTTFCLKFDLAKCQTNIGNENSNFVDFWSGFDVSLDIGSRLRPIFNQRNMQICEKIFKLLFKVRYIHNNLHKSWLELLKNKTPVFRRDFFEANNLMLFFVDNLHFYLQVDILDGFYKQLIDDLKGDVDDYQKAKIIIDEFFQQNLTNSCFLECKELSKIIDGLLDNCLQYAKFVVENFKKNEVDQRSEMEKFEELFTGYKRRASLFFKILSNPRRHLINPQLGQLLQRLDMNGYFSNFNLF